MRGSSESTVLRQVTSKHLKAVRPGAHDRYWLLLVLLVSMTWLLISFQIICHGALVLQMANKEALVKARAKHFFPGVSER